MNDRVNIRKIAREAGLSIASVSRVVNGKSGVSEDTRHKINLILHKYNYMPESRLMGEKKIALVCGENNIGDYIDKLLEGIHSYTIDHNLNTSLIFKNSNSQMTLLEHIRDLQCSGVIAILPATFRGDLDELAASDLPVIMIDSQLDKPGLGFIDHDAYNGSCQAAEYLLKLGHLNIGYIEHRIQTLNHLQRVKGYTNTLNLSGIGLKPEWHTITTPGVGLLEGGYNGMLKLLDAAPELTAVMTTNDNIAMGALKALFDRGVKVPTEMSVIGFDNYFRSEYLCPALTTINHPIKEIGFIAAQEIDSYLKDHKNRKLPREIVPTKLVVRDSSGPPPHCIG